MSSSALNAALLQALIADIRQCVSDKNVDVTSAVALVAKTMELAHRHLSGVEGLVKREYVVIALTEIAKGKDGIAGTEDDLIPPSTMSALKMLIESDLLGQTINTIWDAVKGRISLGEAAVPVANNCISLCVEACGKR